MYCLHLISYFLFFLPFPTPITLKTFTQIAVALETHNADNSREVDFALFASGAAIVDRSETFDLSGHSLLERVGGLLRKIQDEPRQYPIEVCLVLIGLVTVNVGDVHVLSLFVVRLVIDDIVSICPWFFVCHFAKFLHLHLRLLLFFLWLIHLLSIERHLHIQ
jgi:hypothetical protein